MTVSIVLFEAMSKRQISDKQIYYDTCKWCWI